MDIKGLGIQKIQPLSQPAQKVQPAIVQPAPQPAVEITKPAAKPTIGSLDGYLSAIENAGLETKQKPQIQNAINVFETLEKEIRGFLETIDVHSDEEAQAVSARINEYLVQLRNAYQDVLNDSSVNDKNSQEIGIQYRQLDNELKNANMDALQWEVKLEEGKYGDMSYEEIVNAMDNLYQNMVINNTEDYHNVTLEIKVYSSKLYQVYRQTFNPGATDEEIKVAERQYEDSLDKLNKIATKAERQLNGLPTDEYNVSLDAISYSIDDMMSQINWLSAADPSGDMESFYEQLANQLSDKLKHYSEDTYQVFISAFEEAVENNENEAKIKEIENKYQEIMKKLDSVEAKLLQAQSKILDSKYGSVSINELQRELDAFMENLQVNSKKEYEQKHEQLNEYSKKLYAAYIRELTSLEVNGTFDSEKVADVQGRYEKAMSTLNKLSENFEKLYLKG